jgi:hypothetical protein
MQSKPKSFFESETQEGKGVTLSWHDLNVFVPVPGKGFFQRSSMNKPFKKVLNNGKKTLIISFLHYYIKFSNIG